MRFRKIKMKRVHMPEVSLTPLIDTFATLLVVFIIAAPMVQNSIKLDLPEGKSKEAEQTQELVVSLDKDDALFFNGTRVERKELVAGVQKALEGKPDAPVFVQADQAVAYGRVIELVEELKQAHVKYVAMATRQPSANAA
ncbi:MAG: biopolymer transporter ExbD [Epsilonproteobacteria bacterium]|nr:biopolymer transporter ExbD [Campylobacterota bacterium]